MSKQGVLSVLPFSLSVQAKSWFPLAMALSMQSSQSLENQLGELEQITSVRYEEGKLHSHRVLVHLVLLSKFNGLLVALVFLVDLIIPAKPQKCLHWLPIRLTLLAPELGTKVAIRRISMSSCFSNFWASMETPMVQGKEAKWYPKP